MKQLGCSTLLYRHFSLAQALDGIRKAGGYAVELCGRPSVDKQFTHLDLNLDDGFDNHCKSITIGRMHMNIYAEHVVYACLIQGQPLCMQRHPHKIHMNAP